MNQTGKFCWSNTQDLLVRVASFAAPSSAKISQQSTCATRRIPKKFLRREIPTLAFSFLISLILSTSFQKASFAQNSDSLSGISNDDLLVLGSEKRNDLRSKNCGQKPSGFAESIKSVRTTSSMRWDFGKCRPRNSGDNFKYSSLGENNCCARRPQYRA
jgi:hypothetical protein